MCWCTPELRTPNCGKPNCHPPGKQPLRLMPATVRLDHGQVVEAIRAFVEAAGYRPGEVTIQCTPADRNGPDSFSAEVEVNTPTEPRP